MAFDVNNFVIDRVIRGIMFDKSNGEALWSVNQIEDPSLKVTSENKDAVDALGTTIMTFERGKEAEFTASNSLFDLGLAAAQFGTAKSVASSTNTYSVPMFEEITITAEQKTAGSVLLSKTPAFAAAAGIPFIYMLNGDSTLASKFAYGAVPSTTAFSFSNDTLSLPTSVLAGDTILVPYDYIANGNDGNGAVAVTNTAVDFPRGGRFVLEVLGSDVCDATTLYYAYIVLPQAKLQGDVDLSFTTDGKHPFSMKAMQDYCDQSKKLFTIVIPEV